MKLLNIGAGNRIIAGAINHDIVKHRDEINSVWDLNKTPWTWETDEFDRIEFISVIEHLEITPLESLNQCWRILKKGGELKLKYPIHTSPTIYDDLTHRWFLSPASIDYVDPSTKYGQDYAFYTPFKWTILDKGVHKERNLIARLTPLK